MKFVFPILSILTFLCPNLYSQINENSCSDSSYRIQYTSLVPSLSIVTFKSEDRSSFLFSGGIINPISPAQTQDMIFGKMNTEGNVLWGKYANRIPFNENCIIYDFASNANNIYWAGSFFGGTNRPFIIKTDTSGNIISSFYYTINYGLGSPSFAIRKIKYISDNEIYVLIAASESGTFSPYNLIMKIRNDGSILWSKAFKTGNGFNTNAGNFNDIIKQGSDVYIFGDFANFSQNNLAGMFRIRLTELDGQFIETISYSIPKLHEYTSGQYSTKFNIKNTIKGLTIFSIVNVGTYAAGGNYRNKAIKIELDSSLNINKIIEISPTIFNLNDIITDVDVNENNQSCITINNGFYYYHTLLNEQDSLSKTIKAKASATSFPTDYTLNRLVYDSNGTISNLMQHYTPAQDKYELFRLKKNWKNSTEDCMGKDTSFVTIKEISYLPYNFVWDAIADNIAQQQPLNISVNNLSLLDEIICKEYISCDTIKIKGNNDYCLSNPIATFTLHKNPQCLRKTNWIIDTSFIRVISQPNDTTINVEFLKTFYGYIKAGFEDCTLKDSLFINVNKPKQSLNLGKDTIFCPNKTIALNAGTGFKTYRWQDNSNDSVFTTTQPGTYFVEAIDSCNNIFTDTILIKPIDVNFDLQYPNPICLYDTASVILNPVLKNYLWTPATTAIKENNIIKFFPENNTLFNITADRFSGCTLSDTLLIKVIVCPIYIYIPNAFTPNNDGRNDVFRPLISGRIEQYQFSVYNRLGQRVFNSTNYNEGWDGKIKGKPQDGAVFVWICSYKFLNQEAKFKKGTVSLIR